VQHILNELKGRKDFLNLPGENGENLINEDLNEVVL
jgi:hypothetical protein